MSLRVVAIIGCLLLSSCASGKKAVVDGPYSIVFGIVTKADQRPLVVDRITTVIPLNPDGTMPRIAAHVTSAGKEPFLLSYVVYRRDQASREYVRTETSPLWRIAANPQPPSAMIRPDFLDGIFIGEYRFEIFVDQRYKSTVYFSVVPSGT